MRFFNTEGPIRPDRHYHIPPLDRVNLDELLGLVRDERYFVLHAPRQTGKTSALLALRDRLNAGGEYRCVYVDVEAGQAARENVAEAMRVILYQLESEEQATLGADALADIWPGALERAGPLGALRASLERWCMADPRPLVLLIDEIDALVGDTLLAVLRQLRTGYVAPSRGASRTASSCAGCVTCATTASTRLRENAAGARRQRLQHQGQVAALGRLLGDREVRALLGQHTAATGQVFTARRRCETDPDARLGRAAVAGERAVPGGMLRETRRRA